MTRGLYGWKPPSSARNFLAEREAQIRLEQAYAAANERTQESRDWLAAYRTTSHPTRFNWSGNFSAPITKETIDEEAIEAAFEEAAREAAKISAAEGVGNAAAEGCSECSEGGCEEVRPESPAGGGPGCVPGDGSGGYGGVAEGGSCGHGERQSVVDAQSGVDADEGKPADRLEADG